MAKLPEEVKAAIDKAATTCETGRAYHNMLDLLLT